MGSGANSVEQCPAAHAATLGAAFAGVTVPPVGQYDDPNDATVPGGLTPKQRIAWRKEEERRRRELELQV